MKIEIDIDLESIIIEALKKKQEKEETPKVWTEAVQRVQLHVEVRDRPTRGYPHCGWAPPTRFSSKVPLPTVGIAWFQILKYHSVCDQVRNLVVTFTIIYT